VNQQYCITNAMYDRHYCTLLNDIMPKIPKLQNYKWDRKKDKTNKSFIHFKTLVDKTRTL